MRKQSADSHSWLLSAHLLSHRLRNFVSVSDLCGALSTPYHQPQHSLEPGAFETSVISLRGLFTSFTPIRNLQRLQQGWNMRYPAVFLLFFTWLLISNSAAPRVYAKNFDLESRGSSGSDTGSQPPSPSRNKGKAPAHETGPSHQVHSVRLFGVNVTPGKPSSPGRPNHFNQAHTAHPPSHSSPHPQTKQPGRLGHLIPDMGSDQFSYKRIANPMGRPKKGTYVAPGIRRPRRKAGSSSEPKSKEPWWKKKGGTPNIQGGTHRWYNTSRNRRERQKLEKQAGPVSEHPSGHQHHQGGGGPGSPGAGSHAVSKRRLRGHEY